MSRESMPARLVIWPAVHYSSTGRVRGVFASYIIRSAMTGLSSMNNVEFWTIRASDKEYYDAMRKIDREASLGLDMVNFGGVLSDSVAKIEANQEFKAALDQNAPLFNVLSF